MATIPTELIGILLDSSPWPLIRADGSLLGGSRRPIPKECLTCPQRPCRQHDHTRAAPATCVRQLEIIQFRVADQRLCIPDRLTHHRWRSLPRKVKKSTRDRVVSLDDVDSWVHRIRGLVTRYYATIDTRVSDMLGMFHDVQTTLSALTRNTEAWVLQRPGTNRDQKLEALTSAELNIVKTVELLHARVALMPLVANPAAASFGRKRRTPVYRACDRIVRILAPNARKRRVRLQLGGRSFNEPDCYESFDTIPLVLIDNAIKYSLPDQCVDITINDGPDAGVVIIEITSMSPRISDTDSPRIFEKGYRGHFSEMLVARGAGLGLYLGQTVAKAHGTIIQHSCKGSAFSKNGVEYSENTFRVALR